MTALIFATHNTPYDSGCFQFDICLPPTYPKKPPLVNIMTTGNGTVRFSPNLYSNGKVCLSLLGTWRGDNVSQNWSPKTSNIWQVLVSIQSCILGSEFPYFDEPGCENLRGTSIGELNKRVAFNGGYELLRLYTIEHAMINQIQNPPKGFEELVLTHFRLKKNYIIALVTSWICESELSNTSGYYTKIKKLGDRLFEVMEKI